MPSTGHAPLRLLAIDDDPLTQPILARLAANQGCVVTRVTSLAEARVRLARAHFDVILLSLMLADECGSRLLPELRHLAPDTAVIIMSPIDDERIRSGLLTQGACDYILKPFGAHDLLRRIVQAGARRGRVLPTGPPDGAYLRSGGRGRKTVHRLPHVRAALTHVIRTLARIRRARTGAHP